MQGEADAAGAAVPMPRDFAAFFAQRREPLVLPYCSRHCGSRAGYGADAVPLAGITLERLVQGHAQHVADVERWRRPGLRQEGSTTAGGRVARPFDD
jgi:hypothetical protein